TWSTRALVSGQTISAMEQETTSPISGLALPFKVQRSRGFALAIRLLVDKLTKLSLESHAATIRAWLFLFVPGERVNDSIFAALDSWHIADLVPGFQTSVGGRAKCSARNPRFQWQSL